MDLYDEIYFTMLGQMEPTSALQWVPNAFAPNELCAKEYERMIQARDRLLDRLGVDDDEDVEIILNALSVIQYFLCRQIMSLRRM